MSTTTKTAPILIRAIVCVLLLVILPSCTSLKREEKRKQAEQRIDKLRIELVGHLRSATEFTLLSLKPSFELTNSPPEMQLFHGNQILGSARIGPEKGRAAIIAAVDTAMAVKNPLYALCFNPRHGIRAQTPAGPVDLVICCECSNVVVYSKKQGQWGAQFTRGLLVLNQALSDAGIPIPQ